MCSSLATDLSMSGILRSRVSNIYRSLGEEIPSPIIFQYPRGEKYMAGAEILRSVKVSRHPHTHTHTYAYTANKKEEFPPGDKSVAGGEPWTDLRICPSGGSLKSR